MDGRPRADEIHETAEDIIKSFVFACSASLAKSVLPMSKAFGPSLQEVISSRKKPRVLVLATAQFTQYWRGMKTRPRQREHVRCWHVSVCGPSTAFSSRYSWTDQLHSHCPASKTSWQTFVFPWQMSDYSGRSISPGVTNGLVFRLAPPLRDGIVCMPATEKGDPTNAVLSRGSMPRLPMPRRYHQQTRGNFCRRVIHSSCHPTTCAAVQTGHSRLAVWGSG